MKKWHFNNRGITLVELIVTVAIMTIVGGAITSFIVTAQKNYGNGSSETDLQYEAQMVVNQLQDLMIDTARGISYQYSSDAMESPVYILGDSEIPDSAVQTTKTLYIYDQTVYYLLTWDETKKEIRFFEYDKDGNIMAGVDANGELLAEYVTGFSVDLSDLATNRTVAYVLTLTKEGTGRTYTTSHKIKLRNEVLVNADRGVIYVPEEKAVEADGIIVEPEFLFVWPGDSATLSHRVTSTKGGIPSQSVDWEITEHKDGSGNVISDTTVDAATSKLITTLAAIEDVDHLFRVNATKVIPEREEPLRGVPGTTVKLRGITGITATDTEGNSSTNTVDKNVIQAGTIVTVTAQFAGYHLDNQSNVDIGGANISIESGKEYLKDFQYNEGSGQLTFTVRDDLDFSNHKTYNAVIEFRVRRNGFTQYSCKMNYTIKERGDFDITIPENSWKRNGTINMLLSNVEADFIEERDGGIYFKDSYGNKQIQITLHFYDTVSNRNNADITLNNYGNTTSAEGTYTMQDQNGVCTVLIYGNDLSKLKVTLNPLETFAYSFPYYTTKYDWGGNWSPCADYVDITVTIGGSLKQTVTLPIEPVSFGYRRFLVEEAGDTWSDPEENELYTIYVSTDTESDHTYKIYYKLLSGWVEAEDGKPNSDYRLYKDRFVGIIGDASDNKRYTFSNIEIGQEGNNKNGENYLKFTLGELLPTGTVINTIYEYNPLFGEEHATEWSNLPEKQKEWFSQVKGCKGGIRFVFVDPNVVTENVTAIPSSHYCPPPEELSGNYYYISETERYKIEKDTYGNTILGYQIKTNEGIWSNPWGQRGLHWNAATEQWVLNNVVITDNRVRPTLLYCPEPNAENQSKFTVDARGYVYLLGSEKEYYKLISYENGVFEMQYVNENSMKYGWGDAVLYWDTTNKIWTNYEDNVEPNTNWSGSKPTILYCPDPDQLTGTELHITQKDGLYYYRISATEYYVYDPSEKSIYFATSSSSNSISNMTKVWGAGKVLYWNAYLNKWTEQQGNVVITDDRKVPSQLYCPAPESTSEWTRNFWGDYVYIINNLERYVRKEVNGNYTIAYQVRNSSLSLYNDAWGDAVLYWDATNMIWSHGTNIVIPQEQQTKYVMPSIAYCPSPTELKELAEGGQLLKNGKNYYYYISDTERFIVKSHNGKFDLIKYDKTVGNSWGNAEWKNDLEWNATQQIWTRDSW